MKYLISLIILGLIFGIFLEFIPAWLFAISVPLLVYLSIKTMEWFIEENM